MRIGLRPVASPAPMGFAALAVATLLLSMLQLGWLSYGDGTHVSIAVITFAFPLQLIAGLFGFLARDAVVGTSMAVLSVTWLATGVVKVTLPVGTVTSPTLGVLTLAVALILLVPVAGGAETGKLLASTVLLAASVRFFFTAGYEFTGAQLWATVAGLVGLVLCVIALYAALALLLEDVCKRAVLPVFRRGVGSTSAWGDLRDQQGDIESEAGVRERL
ncbi:hypothetical protein LP52_13945 [Streptomonospora alba]|uniref:GPR1/FUN34/yaaH family protein n=1 Tax=Streptomonospora alba TaxID=183763 RepID=A0A0C2JH96_9ACTN|nr:GPR1/FUN34/YaaH family transporter [Streptomonospora alba]KIH98265.1 hypothetical protein LP52_13945 [Streptomonospora alba]